MDIGPIGPPISPKTRANVWKAQTSACGTFRFISKSGTPPVKERSWETFYINDGLVPGLSVDLIEGYLDDANQTQKYHESIQAIYRDGGQELVDENTGQKYTLYTYWVMTYLEIPRADGTFNDSYQWTPSNAIPPNQDGPPWDPNNATYWFDLLGSAWSSIEI